MRTALIALVLVESLACHTEPAAPPVAPAAEAVAPSTEAPATDAQAATAPALPEDAFIQVWLPASGELARVAADGRYLVTSKGGVEAQQTPKSKDDPDAKVVSPEALARIGAALDTVSFFELPPQVDGSMRVAEMMTESTGQEAKAVTVVISARRDGKVNTVTVQGDPTVVPSLGALAPIYAAVDREAIGGWEKK
jgi:hypothetical protein